MNSMRYIFPYVDGELISCTTDLQMNDDFADVAVILTSENSKELVNLLNKKEVHFSGAFGKNDPSYLVDLIPFATIRVLNVSSNMEEITSVTLRFEASE